MYYEEKVINGVLSWRGLPDDCWTPFTDEQLTDMLRSPLNRAAPDMLKALEGCVQALRSRIGSEALADHFPHKLKAAESAIAKAKETL